MTSVFYLLQYSSEEGEEDLDDTMARLSKKKKVCIHWAVYSVFVSRCE
jgi:hypothetical protein